MMKQQLILLSILLMGLAQPVLASVSESEFKQLQVSLVI